jgi:hypothetical protein
LCIYDITFIYSKRYIRTYRKRVYRCDGLVWLIMIHLTVPKMEIDIPKRDIQSKSPSDCSIDLFSILWFYCRLWFIVSDDGRFDLKRINIFHWKTVISTAVISLQSYLLHRFTVKPVKPFLYISPIFLGNIVGVEFDYECVSIVTEVWENSVVIIIAEFFPWPK